ncbi:MAG: hypothetical protein ACXV76_04640 [Halobacteriota archaeon]
MRCDEARTLLARYVVTKGLNDVQGIKMAKTMLKHSGSVYADAEGRVSEFKQFEECLSRTRRYPKMNHWSCEDVWSSNELRARGACTGWGCEYYPSELRKESGAQSGYFEAQTEQEVLTYLLNNPQSIGEGLRMGLLSEGFNDEYRCRDGSSVPLNRVLWHVCRYLAYHGRSIRCTSILASLSRSPAMRPLVDDIELYLQRLQSRQTCRDDKFIECLSVICARGARLRAKEVVRQATIALESSSLPLDVIVRTLGQQLRTLSITARDKKPLFEEDLSDFVSNFFSSRCSAISTRSEWLNASLGGGWKPGMVYAVNASSAVQATDFCAWCAEFAAQRRFPTIFLSWAISKNGFAECAMARHCDVVVEELSQYRKNGFCDGDATMLERIVEGGERLSRRIASNLVMIEVNSEMTASDVRRVVRTAQDRVRMDCELPTLLILDQLPVQSSGKWDPSHTARERVQSDENSLIEGVKRQMQDSLVAIIASFSRIETLGETKFAKEKFLHNDLKGSHAADCTLALQSKCVKVRGTTLERKLNQFDLAREWYKRSYPRFRDHIDRLFDEAEGNPPIDEATSSYARISLFGKGSKTIANPVIIYERPYHRFRTLNMEPIGLERHEMAFDETHLSSS